MFEKPLLSANPRVAGSPRRLTLSAEAATTSGTSVDITGILPHAKRVTVQFSGMSTDGTSIPIIQLGDSGGFETSNYLGAVSGSSAANHSSGFALRDAWAAANISHGVVVLTLQDLANNTWVAQIAVTMSSSTAVGLGSGAKALSGTLTQIRLTTAGGTDNFDAGAISVLVET